MNLLYYCNFIILFENMLFPEERRVEEKKEEFNHTREMYTVQYRVAAINPEFSKYIFKIIQHS